MAIEKRVTTTTRSGSVARGDSKSGFTLVEILVSMGLTAVVLVSVTTLFHRAHSAQVQARATTEATAFTRLLIRECWTMLKHC